MRSTAALLGAVILALAVPGAARAAELIMFESPGCVWCVRWHAEVGPGYPNSDEGRLAPLRRRQLADGVPAGLSLKGAVTYTPTFVLVDGDREIGRITGYPGADFFWGLLEEIVRKLPRRPGPPALQETRVEDRPPAGAARIHFVQGLLSQAPAGGPR